VSNNSHLGNINNSNISNNNKDNSFKLSNKSTDKVTQSFQGVVERYSCKTR